MLFSTIQQNSKSNENGYKFFFPQKIISPQTSFLYEILNSYQVQVSATKVW